MDSVFPFGFPFATAFYLTVYVVTLALHVAFMNYVLAGTAYLAVKGRVQTPSAYILKDWMPLMLSGAITAGVAPLLFVQILYKEGYYTANLLLFNRWMAILPVLIVGFYALYLLKSGWLKRRSPWFIAILYSFPFLCIAFTGYSWTENHLLSVRQSSEWVAFYATKSQFYVEPQLLPRLLVWAFGAIPTLMTILAWQLSHHGHPFSASHAKLAIGGIVLALASASGYYFVADDTTRHAFFGGMGLPWFVLAWLGIVIQVIGWVLTLRAEQWSHRNLLIITGGLSSTLLGMTVCREAVRIATLGRERFEALHPIHQEAFSRGGFPFFVFFFVVNTILIGLCFWIVRTQRADNETNPH